MLNKNIKCETCLYYVENERKCRRYPQHVNRLNNDWCGEYRNKKKVNKEEK